MKTLSTLPFLALFTSALHGLAGCQDAAPPLVDEPKVASSSSSSSGVPVASGADLVRADRLLAAGDAKGAIAAYDAVIDAAGAGAEAVGRARLGKSHALAIAGDREAAIALAETVVATVRDSDQDRSTTNDAQEWLFELLRDRKSTSFPMNDDGGGVFTPFAKTLVPSFEPANPDQKMRVNVLAFGEFPTDHSDAIGLFNVAGAWRAKKQEACGLCTVKSNVGTHRSRSSWTSIAAQRERLQDHLVVVYFDLERNLVPSRYDDVLPMPSAEVQKELAKGGAFYLVKDRGAAPPVILIAAPRTIQLAAVEDALAKETSWPKGSVPVKIAPQYTPGEIRAHVRSAQEPYRACFDEYAARVPHASIRSTLAFTIEPTGAVGDVRVDSEPADAKFGECLATATRAIRFTGIGAPTTVRYPITFTHD